MTHQGQARCTRLPATVRGAVSHGAVICDRSGRHRAWMPVHTNTAAPVHEREPGPFTSPGLSPGRLPPGRWCGAREERPRNLGSATRFWFYLAVNAQLPAALRFAFFAIVCPGGVIGDSSYSVVRNTTISPTTPLPPASGFPAGS